MSNQPLPVQQLQEFRRRVAKLDPDDKSEFHAAKRAIREVIEEYGQMAELAVVYVGIEDAVKRGDK